MSGRETCYECARSWGVTMRPRERVLCTPCARPLPWRRPAEYWRSRLRNQQWPSLFAAVEWLDARTTRDDLRLAVAAAVLPATPAALPGAR